jgi:hypothetical protein
MALTPSWMTDSEGEEVYIDKGAVSMPQINPEVAAKYAAGKATADAADFVEWPTDVHGQETQGF